MNDVSQELQDKREFLESLMITIGYSDDEISKNMEKVNKFTIKDIDEVTKEYLNL